MRKECYYEIKYREEGIERTFPVNINFVSNFANKEYREITNIRFKVYEENKKIQELKSSLALEEDKEKIEDIKNQIDLSVQYIISNSDYFGRQFDLINLILKDNNIKDKKINTLEFWDKQVDPVDCVNFLHKVITKEDDGSKGTKGEKKK